MPKDKITYKAALNRAAALCSRQEQSSARIREKLKDWNADEADTDRIIQKLQQENFLDDRRYAIAFAQDKFMFNRWGRIKISHMLRTRGIQDETIREAITGIDEEDYIRTCSELIKRKASTLKEKNRFTRKAKLFRYAAGRGFESELIYRILNTDELE